MKNIEVNFFDLSVVYSFNDKKYNSKNKLNNY